jgi:voltage-gated potassium channel
MTKSKQSKELKSTSYEIFILLLSLLSLFNLAMLLIPSVDPVIKQVIRTIDAFTTLIFILDFLYRFFTAESKSIYFFRNFGWADFLASLPVPQLKIFRVFRVVRVFRLFHLIGWRTMWYELRYNRAGSALYLTVFLVLLLLEFGGIAIVFTEAGATDSNIRTAADAIWWGFVTITTVGYGDRYPVTNSGRVIGMVVMTAGVALFGVITGFLANAFLSPGESGKRGQIENEIESGEDAEVRRLLEHQDDVNARILARLEKIEQLLDNNP